MIRFALTVILSLQTSLALGATITTSEGDLQINEVVDGLDTPWAFEFLPGGEVLITERDGELLLMRSNGQLSNVRHGLDVFAEGQGGLLDVMVPRDFDTSREIFLSFTKSFGRTSGTALAVAKLRNDGKRLIGAKVIFEMAPGFYSHRHYGSRIVEARDGTIFLTIGDRGDRPSAQDNSVTSGTIIRINRDGTIPADNPFLDQPNVRPEIWSFGHRNPQGAALDLSGQLWAVEHGARGGDEVNMIKPGTNYGWPVIAYGRHYSGAKIGEGNSKPGMEQPAHYWDPSIAPSGMMIYSGKLWPNWRGNIFIGSLKFDYISRLTGAKLTEVEQIASQESGRVRDVKEAPDGSIWFLSIHDGALYRISPE